MTDAVLEVEDLSAAYRGVVAVDRVGLGVPAGRIVTVIGPNGAG